MDTTKPITIGAIRGAASGLVSFGIMTLTTYQVAGGWEEALVAGGIAGLTTLATRWGIEGVIDQRAVNRK